ncbi:MAG TPA: CRISPR-associated endonuclease Cas1 [Clostridia bacterium]|nr:CRISPR-associated endonuclease Cas1 [Clostridia bacterium]
MAQLYIVDHKASIGIEKGRVQVKYGDGLLQSLPIENLEGITIIGNAQVTTRCIGECLRKGIAIQYFSSKGAYFGKVSSTQHVNTRRQRLQVKLTEDVRFSTTMAKQIIKAKINNQTVVLRRYQRTSNSSAIDEINMLKALENKMNYAGSIPEILGYEGSAARIYYRGLNNLIDVDDFKFKGRSRRPPKDAFNSMLSLGYAMIMNDVYGSIEGRGLNPYFGFIHQDKEKHPTLSSDLIEEWRAVIVDSLVMSLVNGSEIGISNFYIDDEVKGVFIDKKGLKIFISKMEKRLATSIKYLSYLDYPMSLRKAIDCQVMQLCKAIEANDPTLYEPVRIR